MPTARKLPTPRDEAKDPLDRWVLVHRENGKLLRINVQGRWEWADIDPATAKCWGSAESARQSGNNIRKTNPATVPLGSATPRRIRDVMRDKKAVEANAAPIEQAPPRLNGVGHAPEPPKPPNLPSSFPPRPSYEENKAFRKELLMHFTRANDQLLGAQRAVLEAELAKEALRFRIEQQVMSHKLGLDAR